MVKNEKGYTLAMVLVLTLLLSLISFAILTSILTTRGFIKRTDQYTQKLDAEELALQEAKLSLGKKIAGMLAPENTEIQDLGTDGVALQTLLTTLVTDWNATNTAPIQLGKETNPSFTMKIKPITVAKGDVWFNKRATSGSVAEILSDSEAISRGLYAYETTFPIEVAVTSQDGKVKNVTADYCYTIQWVSKDAGDIAVQGDYWSNTNKVAESGRVMPYSQPKRTSTELYRQMTHQQNTGYLDAWDLSGMDPVLTSLKLGKRGEFLVDYHDKGGLIDLSNAHKMGMNNRFYGSLTLQKGVKILGVSGLTPASSLTVDNTLNLGNIAKNSSKTNYIKDVTLTAGTGITIRMNQEKNETTDEDKDGVIGDIKKNSRLVIDNDPSEHLITSPNLLIRNSLNNDNETNNTLPTNTIPEANREKSGVALARGKIQVGETTSRVPWQDYRPINSSTPVILDEDYWNRMLSNEGSSFLIQDSAVYLGPETYSVNGSSFTTTLDDPREILVAGNFMLSSGYDSKGDRLNYILNDTLNVPSRLELIGKNTKIEVQGLSHIDAPKRHNKEFLGASLTEPAFDEYYPKPASPGGQPTVFRGYPLISLKEKSSMRLGYTSVEPFELKMENGTVFRMKVMPYVLFFDDYFLKSWKENGKKGKVILEVGNETEANLVISKLPSGVAHVKLDKPLGDFVESEAENGKVTIVNAQSGLSNKLQYISRTSATVNNIKY